MFCVFVSDCYHCHRRYRRRCWQSATVCCSICCLRLFLRIDRRLRLCGLCRFLFVLRNSGQLIFLTILALLPELCVLAA